MFCIKMASKTEYKKKKSEQLILKFNGLKMFNFTFSMFTSRNILYIHGEYMLITVWIYDPSKTHWNLGAEDIARWLQHLPSMCEALGFIFSTVKVKKDWKMLGESRNECSYQFASGYVPFTMWYLPYLWCGRKALARCWHLDIGLSTETNFHCYTLLNLCVLYSGTNEAHFLKADVIKNIQIFRDNSTIQEDSRDTSLKAQSQKQYIVWG